MTSDELPKDKIVEYGKELWALGNVVAGFCIVQTILFLEEFGKHCSELGITINRHWQLSMFCILLFLLSELTIIWLCDLGHRRVLSGYNIPRNLHQVFRWAFCVRAAVVAVGMLAPFLCIVASVCNENNGGDNYSKKCSFESKATSTVIPR